MSATKTLMWAVILLALAAFYYFYDIQAGRRWQEAIQQRERLAHFQADEVTGCTITRQGESIRAEKRQGHWYLTEPVRVAADDQKYHELIHYVAELRHVRRIEEQPATLEPFGLSAPGLEIHVSFVATSFVLRLGAKNPTRSGYYAQVAGDPTIHLVHAVAKDVLDASLHDLRNKTVLAFTPAEVQEVRVTTAAEAPVVLQRQSNSQWQMTVPISTKVSDERVHALLQSLHEVRVKAFIAETPAVLQPYGLETPTLRLTLDLGKTQPVQTLLLGKVDEARQGVYAKGWTTCRFFKRVPVT